MMSTIEVLKRIRYLFTKEYKEEVEYMEFLEKNVSVFKLKTNSESIEDKIKRIKTIEPAKILVRKN